MKARASVMLGCASLLGAGLLACGGRGLPPARDGGVAAGGLVQITDLRYAGAFRLPADRFGISELNYSEGPIAYDPARGSLFIVGHTHQQAIAELAVPALVRGTTLSELAMAGAPVQTFASVLDRAGGGNPQELNRIGGLKLVAGPAGPQLLVNAYEHYDAPGDNTQTTLVVRDPARLSTSAVDGFFSFAGAAHAAGWLSPVPPEHRAALGGAMITGASSGVPIIGRLSVGPSAFAFDPDDLIAATSPRAVPTTALLDYDLERPLHADLSNRSGTNDLWTHLSRAVYGFIVPGTRSYVTLGHSGGHRPTGVCYKCIPAGETEACGGYCAVDPTDYGLYYWLYDVGDLAAVRAGRKAPQDVRPYAYGPWDAPFSRGELGGGAFDAASGLLYLTMQRADDEQGTYANPPVVVAFRVEVP